MSTHHLSPAALALLGTTALALVPLGCSSGGSGEGARPDTVATSAAASAEPTNVVVGIPATPTEVAKVVNPKNQPTYAGPTGTLKGIIRVSGDPAPELSVKLPDTACRGEAAATHGKLFRVGQDNTLADALVAVTGYDGYVPAKDQAKKLTIHHCALSTRTVVATFGQRVEVANLDQVDSYMPYLDGARTSAILVATPRGDAVRLYPQAPGHYMLRDQLPNDHMTADVFVLAYSTHDVTGLDGKYEITGIPVGTVEVNAMLPATKKAATQRIEIKPGENTLDLTIAFDAKTDVPKDPAAAAKQDPTSSAKQDPKAAKQDPKSPKPPGPKG